MEQDGVGEILLNAILRDGTMTGYNLGMIKKISSAIGIPLVTCGVAGKPEHFTDAFRYGPHTCSAGRMFVFVGSLHGILISYLSELERSWIENSLKNS